MSNDTNHAQGGQGGEETKVSNQFGTVTSKRVVYQRSKSWFGGGSREDIPLQHVTSVRLDTQRHVAGGLISGIIGFALFSAGGGAILFGVLLVILAALLLWGSPSVVVNTSGQDLSAAVGLPWTRDEAEAFVGALRQELFKESQ